LASASAFFYTFSSLLEFFLLLEEKIEQWRYNYFILIKRGFVYEQ